MSEMRFRFLLRCLIFDDITDRVAKQETDKLTLIRQILELFLANFQNNFTASEYFNDDEQL